MAALFQLVSSFHRLGGHNNGAGRASPVPLYPVIPHIYRCGGTADLPWLSAESTGSASERDPCGESEIRLTENWNKMASLLQNVKATVAWRKHQLLADFDESPVPDKFKRRASLSSFTTIRMSLRKRVPLKRVELNFRKTSTRESLGLRQACQTFQTVKRTAKCAFGTVSQKIQKSCQSPVCPMVTFPAESISRSCATGSTRKRSAMSQMPCYKSVTPVASSKGAPRSSKRISLGLTRVSEHGERRDFSSWLGKNAISLRRSRRAAALKSPYASPAPSSRRLELDCELELVSSGICHLKRISQAFDDAIVKEERQQAISNYCYLITQNLQSAHRSLKLSQAIRRQAKKLY